MLKVITSEKTHKIEFFPEAPRPASRKPGSRWWPLKFCALALVLAFTDSQAFDWPTATADEVGMDPAMLEQLDAAVRQGQYGQVKSLLVLRHGKLVYEGYFRGASAHDLQPLYSVTKSWGGALVGLAIARGELEGLDQPLAEVFSQYAAVFNAAPGKRDITIKDILTMRHGLAWDEWSTSFTSPSNPVKQMTQSADWWQFVLSRPQTSEPGSVFRYSTGTSNLMGALIHSATGLSAIEYSQQHLFGPLEIHDFHLEVDLSGSPRGTGITNFQSGLTPTGHGLWLKPRDLAKLGQLYLDGGLWQGERILPSKWIHDSWLRYSDESTDPTQFSNGSFYGLLWWGGVFQTPEASLKGYVAQGWADQFIIVVPQLDLVVVSNAANGNHNGEDIVDAVRSRIAPTTAPDFDAVNDPGITGSWVSPQLAHQGFMLEVVPTTGQVVIYWMTFEPQTGKQMWLFAVGQMHGRRALLEFLRPQDGVFGGSQQADLQPWGDVDLRFTSCTQATMSFSSPIAGVAGEITLRRITPNVYCQD